MVIAIMVNVFITFIICNDFCYYYYYCENNKYNDSIYDIIHMKKTLNISHLKL